MAWKKAVWLCAVALLMMPLAQAETSISTSATEEEPVMISLDGGGSIPFTVTISCDQFVTEGTQSITREVTASGPDWLVDGDDGSVTFDATDCPASLPDAELSDDTGTVTVTVDGNATGMELTDVTLTTDDDQTTPQPAKVMVEYNEYYEFSSDVEFPLEVTGPVTFNITVDVSQANADTMAMWNKAPDKAEFGTLSGVPDFKNYAPPAAETIAVTYTPTPGDWEEDTVEFITWAHCLCDGTLKTEDETVQWTFVNGGVGGGGDGGDDEEESPGAPVVLLAAGLVGIALVLRRRT